MRKIFFYIALFILLNACNKRVSKPSWVNERPTIYYPDINLVFKSKTINWSATLISFIQPIPLGIKYSAEGFTVINQNDKGVIEGPAQICLSSGTENFYYPVYLENKDSSKVSSKEYCSPKTVNPDSSLQQQRILHNINEYRNLVYLDKKQGYFFEEDVLLSPKARSYRAIAAEPLSAYYIQPGSCVDVPVKAEYDDSKKMYEVTAGPLKDKYGNTSANGTSVAFIYTDDVSTNRMEAALLNGFTTVWIPAVNQTGLSLKAKVNETISKTIRLKP